MTRDRRIDDEAAERMLSGRPTDPSPVADVLAAAAAPPRAGELTGEETAVAAFREARVDAAASGRRGLWSRVLSVRAAALVAAGAVGAAAVVALAYTVDPPGRGESRLAGTPGPAPAPRTEVSSVTPAPGGGPTTAGSVSPHPAVPAEIPGLCLAYLRVGRSAGKPPHEKAPGKALEAPVFRKLIAAAGGPAKVPAYCAEVLKAERRGPDKGAKWGKRGPGGGDGPGPGPGGPGPRPGGGDGPGPGPGGDKGKGGGKGPGGNKGNDKGPGGDHDHDDDD